MKETGRFRSPRQIENTWQQRANTLLKPLPPKPKKENRITRLREQVASSRIGKLQQAMMSWPEKGANWIVERVNGPLEKRLQDMETHPEKLSPVIGETVYKELRKTANQLENRFTTKVADKIPWVVAAAGFIPVAGAFVTALANLTNAGRAAAVEHNFRKAGLYLLFIPLNPVLGFLSILPGVGWVFFPPAILTNSIFVEEMSKKYKIALTEGELSLASSHLTFDVAANVAHAVGRFEANQEKKQQRRRSGVPGVTAQEVLELQLKKRQTAEKMARGETATRRNRKKLVRMLRQSENTQNLQLLLSQVV